MPPCLVKLEICRAASERALHPVHVVLLLLLSPLSLLGLVDRIQPGISPRPMQPLSLQPCSFPNLVLLSYSMPLFSRLENRGIFLLELYLGIQTEGVMYTAKKLAVLT